MRRIGINAGMTFGEFDAKLEPTDTSAHKAALPESLTPPFKCGASIYPTRDAWLMACEKKAHSYRGCTCSPAKVPKQSVERKVEVVDQRLNFGP